MAPGQQPPHQPPPGGYGGPPPAAPYPPYPALPPQAYIPTAPNDGKAVASLVLGLLSLLCFGVLAGIPAIIFGVLARRDIARSNGALGGDGLALGGIITGILSTLITIGVVIFYILIIGAAVASAPTYTPTYTPPYTPYTAPTPTIVTPPAPTGLKPMPYTGMVKVVDLKVSAGSLRTQLALELGAAKDDGNKLLVVTASRACHACDEVFGSFANYTLQRSLANVRVVRVDVDAFASELASLGLDKPGLPWFFRFDNTLKVADAISADEWDDNDAYNIAPVLKAFVAGTYKKRGVEADAGALHHRPSTSETF